MKSSKRGAAKGVLPFIIMAFVAFFIFKNIGNNAARSGGGPYDRNQPANPERQLERIGGAGTDGGLSGGLAPLPGNRKGQGSAGSGTIDGRQVDYETTGGTVSKKDDWTVQEVDNQDVSGRPNLPGGRVTAPGPSPRSNPGLLPPSRGGLLPGTEPGKITKKGNWKIEEVEQKGHPTPPAIPRFSEEVAKPATPNVDNVTKKGNWKVEDIDVPGATAVAPPAPKLQAPTAVAPPAPKLQAPTAVPPAAPKVDNVTKKGDWKVEDIDVPGATTVAPPAPKLQAAASSTASLQTAINLYTLTTGKRPSSLDELVEKKFLKAVPDGAQYDLKTGKVSFADVGTTAAPALPNVDNVTKKGAWTVEDIDVPGAVEKVVPPVPKFNLLNPPAERGPSIDKVTEKGGWKLEEVSPKK